MIFFRSDLILLLGETSKWVPLSPKRVKSIIQTEIDVFVKIQGAINEHVKFKVFSKTNGVHSIDCNLGLTGQVEISVLNKSCRQT